MNTIAEFIKQKRKEAGLTQAEHAIIQAIIDVYRYALLPGD